MAFCTSCGNEISPGARFCGNCGHEQIPDSLKCANCGTELEEGAKFCASCGTSVDAKKAPVAKKTENKTPKKTTASGKKIIDAGPKTKPIRKSTKASSVKSGNTKKKSGIGCFFRTLLILLSIVLVAALLIVVVNLFFIETEETSTSNTQKAKTNSELSDSNIPGIVDVESGDDNLLSKNEKSEPNTLPASIPNLNSASTYMQNVFETADTTALKSLLRETSRENYKDIFSEIQPYMTEYAKAFKNRKLVYSNDFFAVYKFKDSDGKEYSVEFSQNGDGNWKLVRF